MTGKTLKTNNMTTLTIEQQKNYLTETATRLFNEGRSTDVVIQALKNTINNLNFSNEINVDAIQYLVKQNIGLI